MYKRRFRGRRSRFGRRKFKRSILGRRRRYGTIARIARRTMLRSAETKWAYSTVANVSADAQTGYYIYIQPNIAQGTGGQQRIGNTLNTRRITFKGYIDLAKHSGATIGANEYWCQRVLIGRFRSQPAGGVNAVAVSDIMDNATINSLVDYNLAKVYYDKRSTVTIPGNYQTLGYTSRQYFNYSSKWRKKWDYYNNVANVETDYDKSLFLIIINEITTAAKLDLVINMCVKTSFVDV